jgi:hypothetical protein
VSGQRYVGGLIGISYYSNDLILNSYATGSVSCSGDYYAGGLVGLNRGLISYSYASGSVNGICNTGGLVGNNQGSISISYATGTVYAGSTCGGGLVGYNQGSISDSFATGSVDGYSRNGGLVGCNFYGSVSNSYSTGSVSSLHDPSGGLIGGTYGQATSSYWDIETSGQTYSVSGTGKTTAEMMQQATFVGWDFVNIWDIIEDNTYPFFQPQNEPPEITTIDPVDPVAVNTDLVMTGHFTDPDDDDIHTAEWDWGDTTTSTGTVDEEAGTVTGTHPYTETGIYTVTLTVTDEASESDSLEYQFIVVYDPEGGFVTGGGWIDSPAGAYRPDTSLSGKANFGFVSKYKKGSTTPTGNTEFQFKVADLNFHSDTYDWLVIAGDKAQFKGTGTINGAGEYKFILTAIDNDDGTDKFRIKIWEEDESGNEVTIYDNDTDGDGEEELTAIGGGSIVIHTGKKK